MTTHQLLQQHVTRLLESDASLSEDQADALRRLISKNSDSLRMALAKVERGFSQETMGHYLQEVIELYLNIESFQPCRESDYKDWLREVRKEADVLSAEMTSSPSIDLFAPPSLVNAAALIQAVLVNLSGEMGGKLYEEEVSSTLKRILQQMPVTVFLDAISQTADEALNSHPVYYWEKECDITSPRKNVDHHNIFREQVLLRGIKRITLRFFDKPNHELVAVLANTLLGYDKFDEDSVRKLP